MTVEEEVDRFTLWTAPKILAESDSDFERGFVRSIVRLSKRKGWLPSDKQLAVMRRLAAEARQPDEINVVEADDD